MSGTVRQDDVCNEVLSQSRAGCRCGRKFVQDPRDRAKREPIIPGEWLPESKRLAGDWMYGDWMYDVVSIGYPGPHRGPSQTMLMKDQ